MSAIHTCVAVVLAIGLDLLLGEPPSVIHPVIWMGWFLRLGERLNPCRGKVGPLLVGGGWVCLGALVFALLGALPVGVSLPGWLWVIVGAIWLKTTFSIRALFRAGREVQAALERGQLEEARRLVGWHLVSRDTSELSGEQVIAATIESLAENITDGFAAPLFYFALIGLPGAWAYRFCNTADAMWGYRDPQREYFGKVAARLDDLLNLLPARLTALLIVVAAALAGESASRAWKVMWAQHRRTASPNAGWTMAAMAGALGVTLEKVGHYRLEGGDGPLDIRALERCYRVVAWTMGLVGGLAIAVIGGLYGLAT